MFISFIRVIFLCLLAFSVQASNQQQYDAAIADWTRVLEKFVDEQGRTDFKALATDSVELERVVGFIETTSPASHPELFQTSEDVLAYHLNTYNALAMYGVIDRGIPAGFDSFFKRLRFFKLRSVVIGGEKTSLQDYENDVIRPLAEPRAHFALNCMVRDCPRLPQEPFRAGTLEQQLESVTVEFFNKPKHLRIDQVERTVHVSGILKFYTEDFVASGKKRDLPEYINPYLESKIPADYRVQFIDYDWTINQQP